MNLRILLAALLALTPTAAHAAIFDDGNDRKLIKNLRAKDAASLTEEEKAILAAANKVGAIGLCNGTIGGNAFFIRYHGKPAIVTSAHLILDVKSGKLKCADEHKFGATATYMPNANYYDTKDPRKNRAFIFREVKVLVPPANWDELKQGGISHERDFAVFYLSEDIGDDPMPDGSLRGHLDFSRSIPSTGNLYMLGVANDFGQSVEMVLRGSPM